MCLQSTATIRKQCPVRRILTSAWPSGIKARGELRSDPGHVIDLLPTILADIREVAPMKDEVPHELQLIDH